MITEEEVLTRPVNPETKWLLSLTAQRKLLASVGLKESPANSNGWTTLERIPKDDGDDFGGRWLNLLPIGEIDPLTLRDAQRFTLLRNAALLPEYKNRAVTVDEVVKVWRSC
jgi:hypothetical protein